MLSVGEWPGFVRISSKHKVTSRLYPLISIS